MECINEQITKIIDTIKNAKEEEKNRFVVEIDEHGRALSSSVLLSDATTQHHSDETAVPNSDSPLYVEKDIIYDEFSAFVDSDIEQNVESTDNQNVSSKSLLTSATPHTRDKSYDSLHKNIAQGIMSGVKKTTNTLHQGIKKSTDAVHKIGDMSKDLASNLIAGSDDGKVRDGGFVTFTTLTAKNQCVQMLHHGTPFTFQVTEAPLPKHIYWNNVGLTHGKQQLGYLAAQALTVTLCLFWTIPIAFVTSFSQVDSLKTIIPGLEDAIVAHPWIEPLFAQLGPMLLVILKGMLPFILTKFCEREGHVSQTELNASLFTKLSLFLVRTILVWEYNRNFLFAQSCL